MKNSHYKKIGLLALSILLIFPKQALAYIDPGTAGSVAGSVGVGIGLIFGFFGSAAMAVIVKIKKIWNWGFLGKIAVSGSVCIIASLVWFGTNLLLG